MYVVNRYRVVMRAVSAIQSMENGKYYFYMMTDLYRCMWYIGIVLSDSLVVIARRGLFIG